MQGFPKNLRFYLQCGLLIASLTAARRTLAQEDSGSATSDAAAVAALPDPAWCAEELEALDEGTCAYTPEQETKPSTLIVFLHGVIKLSTNWQWAQERAIARAAKRNGVYAIMPRGRSDIASKTWQGNWTWPTSTTAQRAVESELLDEWTSAIKKLEQRRAAQFDKVLVVGFSNGAYYGASLAFRGRFVASGYALFAGGSAPRATGKALPAKAARKPIYVGYGLKDPARRDPQKLAHALKAAGWPHRSSVRARVGHTMTDSQLDDALAFLRGLPATKSRR